MAPIIVGSFRQRNFHKGVLAAIATVPCATFFHLHRKE